MTGQYRNKHTQICTPSLGTTALWTYSNGAVQTRLCLERVAFSAAVLSFFVAVPVAFFTANLLVLALEKSSE